MKKVNNILYIELVEMLEACNVSENYLSKARSIGTKCYSFIDDPDDKRRVLVEYESLKEKYKRKIQKKFGDPYKFYAQSPIRHLIRYDLEAEKFYLNYKYDTNKSLPSDHVKKYSMAASWLNTLRVITKDRLALKTLLKIDVQQFYTNVLEIIKTDKIYLPTSYRRLLIKLKKYEKVGYVALIDWRFGNTMAAKVKDELCKSVLLQMIAHPNQYDDVFIENKYNEWASKKGYKAIDSSTVGRWRRENAHDIVMEREGNDELKNKYLRQAKGFRPTAPLYMVESDDNHLDLMFQDPDNLRAERRYICMVVNDSFNDYPLGYAYALSGTLNDGQTIALIKAAYINAMYHIRSVTGGWYLPHEIKTDNYAIKSMQPFYESIGKYMKTPTGSKNRGFIENSFGALHWKRCLKIDANNYSGNNIRAIHSGVNVATLSRNKKDWPTIGHEAVTQIEGFFHRLRNMQQSNGISKHDEWMAAFNAMPVEEKKLIDDVQFLSKFGIEHNENGKTIRITNRGVEPRINGVKYSFDLEGGSWMEYVGKAVKVIYDPYDMSRVLVTDHENLRIIGHEARLNPRTIKDSRLDSRTYLNAILTERKDDVERIAAKSQRRKQVIASSGIDAESLIKTGVMVKEIKYAAEEKMLSQIIMGNHSEDITEDDIAQLM